MGAGRGAFLVNVQKIVHRDLFFVCFLHVKSLFALLLSYLTGAKFYAGINRKRVPEKASNG
jgi:hypothetical protein